MHGRADGLIKAIAALTAENDRGIKPENTTNPTGACQEARCQGAPTRCQGCPLNFELRRDCAAASSGADLGKGD